MLGCRLTARREERGRSAGELCLLSRPRAPGVKLINPGKRKRYNETEDMHGTGSHPEVLLRVKPELSPTDTAAWAFHILKTSSSEGWDGFFQRRMGNFV